MQLKFANTFILLLNFSLVYIFLYDFIAIRFTVYYNINNNNLASFDVFSNFTYESECESEWEKLNNDVFIRRSSAYYLTDLNLIRIYMVRNLNVHKFVLKIFLAINKTNLFRHTLKNIKLETLAGFGSYKYSYIEAKFVTKDHFFGSTSMKVIISTFDKKARTKYPIDLKIKKHVATDDSKKNAALCGELVFEEKNSTQSLEWYIQIHRLTG